MVKQKNSDYLFFRTVFLTFLFLILITSSSLAEESPDPYLIHGEFIDSIENEGDYDLIKEYLEMGAKPNSMANYRGDALSSAAEYKRDKDIIKLLLDYGAEVESSDLVEFILYGAEIEVLELLVESVPNLNDKVLVDKITDPMVNFNQNFINERKSSNQDFKAEVAEKLLGEDYLYPLITAALADRKDVVELLLDNGADISITDSKGRNAYQIAQENEAGPLLVAELYKAKSKWEEETGETLAADTGNSDKNGQSNSSAKNKTKKIAVTTKIREERKKEENKIIEIVTKEEIEKLYDLENNKYIDIRRGGFDGALFSQNGETLVLIENYDRGKSNGKARDYHKFSFYQLENGVYKAKDSYDFNTFVDTMGFTYRPNDDLALSPDGSLIALRKGNKIEIYKTANLKLYSTITLPNIYTGRDYSARYFAISPDNNYFSILVNNRYGTYIDQWSINTKKRITELEKINLIQNNSEGYFSYGRIKYSPNGRYFIIKGRLIDFPKDASVVTLVNAQTLEVINDFGAAQKAFTLADNDYDLYFDGLSSYAFFHSNKQGKLYDLKNNQLKDIEFDEFKSFWSMNNLVGGAIHQNFLVGLYEDDKFYEFIIDEIDNVDQPVKGILRQEINLGNIYGISYLKQTDEWVILSKKGLHYVEATNKEDYEAEQKAAAAEKAQAENRAERLEEMITARQKKREKAEALYQEGFELMNIGFVEQGYNKYLEAIKTDPISAKNIPKTNQLYNLLGTIEVYQLADIFRTQQEEISNMEKQTKLGFIPVLENNQWIIKAVFAETPAAEAEMEVGDHILLFDGEYLDNNDDLFWYLQDKSPGDQIGLTFISVDAGGDYKEDTYFKTAAGFEYNIAAPSLSTRLFDYGLLAIRSGHINLAQKSIQKLKDLPEKYPADYNKSTEKFNNDAVILLETLIKALNNSSDAYNYLLEGLDGAKLHQNFQGYFKFPVTAELLAPLFVDRAKLAYFTGAAEEELAEVKKWEKVKLSFVDLNGNFIQGEAADPYLE